MEVGIELKQKKLLLARHYERYLFLLVQLEKLTHDYETLAADIKINIVSRHLRELQKTVKPGCKGYQHLFLGMQQLYGT